jgi:hypothetical protein
LLRNRFFGGSFKPKPLVGSRTAQRRQQQLNMGLLIKDVLLNVVCLMIYIFSILWGAFSGRLLSSFILLITLGFLFSYRRHRRVSWIVGLYLLYMVSTVIPYDVSFQNYPGPPRFVPLVMGPGTEARLMALTGQAMLGGCRRSGFEPKWVWVW